ncbi:MAG: formylmethanofuran--tetrahydromethanopterin formyltransferase [Candidatus Bathyarchaeota archaeon B24]|nr:MAG: formylmethanofuran--tetrahydromethanopterin formyltransferase [Candidatus Bathyarchaeota archaeon B24]RLI25596.1 MAG: formylmethanofuran--tetrahydromethanopterin N-formyltransferase [Candidatus Bathyarchaeota archaeon]
MKLNGVDIVDTFTEMFPMWFMRFLITAESYKWALRAGRAATGFGTSIIMSPAECGIEALVPSSKTPDGRPGVLVQIYHTDRVLLKAQFLARIGQCVLTCPTTAVFDSLVKAKRRAKVGKSLATFGDGFQVRDKLSGRDIWRIPVMEGEFIIEESFGIMRGVAGGMFLILAEDWKSGLKAAEESIKAIRKVGGVITPFPGGICRSGSKVGSMKYKLRASTNHLFCPTLKDVVKESLIPEGVKSVYEIVINGVNLAKVKEALGAGIKAAAKVPGVIQITSANYGGKLGPYKLYLKEALE